MTGRKKMPGIFKFSKEKLIKNFVEINIMQIRSNPNKSSNNFNNEKFSELIESISREGIIRPISIRKNQGKYEIIDGEKRFKAAKICGYTTVPCIVRELNDQNYEIYSLVENIKHQSMNFFEEAEAIEQLINIYGLTQDDAALKLGRAQSTIANKLRLLRLTEQERNIIIKFNLTERHARSLLRLGSPEERIEIINKIVENNLNVERTERLIDEAIGMERNKNNYNKKEKIFHDAALFINTINNTINSMKTAGIIIDSKKIEEKNYIEYRFRMPVDIDINVKI